MMLKFLTELHLLAKQGAQVEKQDRQGGERGLQQEAKGGEGGGGGGGGG